MPLATSAAFHSHLRSACVTLGSTHGRLRLKCDGTCAEPRFCLSTKRTSPFKPAEASVQSTTGRRAVHISLQGLYCSCKPVFRCHVTLTGYPLHSPVSPSLLLPCVTVCHHISNAVYQAKQQHAFFAAMIMDEALALFLIKACPYFVSITSLANSVPIRKVYFKVLQVSYLEVAVRQSH